MLDKFNLKMPHAVFGGEKSLEKLTDIIAKNEATRVAFFTDKGVEACGLIELPLEYIKGSGAEYVILDELPPEPTYAQAQSLIDQCKSFGADLIVAVGGGSVMDTAKLASILMTDDYGVKELLDTPAIARKCIKTVLIPTTAGTGSEATPNAIVAVPERELKIGIVNSEMIADYVILDACMVEKLPRKIAAASGVDALAHAIECWTSNKANPFSDIFAMEAMKLIFPGIERACNDPSALQEKKNMLIASFFAGIAISASGTTAVHALSYPLGGKYHIAHGVSNAILLAPVMRFNEDAITERLAIVYEQCIGTESLSTEEKSHAVIRRLEEIVKNLDIPTSLSEFAVSKDDLETLVDSGMQVTRLLNNNIKKLSADDARNIYKEIL